MQPYNTFPLRPGWNPFNEVCSKTITSTTKLPTSAPYVPTQSSSNSSSPLFINFKPRSRTLTNASASTSANTFTDTPLSSITCSHCNYVFSPIHRQHLAFPFPVSRMDIDPRDDKDFLSSRRQPPLVEIRKEELVHHFPSRSKSSPKIKSKDLSPRQSNIFSFSGRKDKKEKEREKIYLTCRRGQPWHPHPSFRNEEQLVRKQRAFEISCPKCRKSEFEIWYLIWKVGDSSVVGGTRERVPVRSEDEKVTSMKDKEKEKEEERGCSSWVEKERSKVGSWLRNMILCCEKVWVSGIWGTESEVKEQEVAEGEKWYLTSTLSVRQKSSVWGAPGSWGKKTQKAADCSMIDIRDSRKEERISGERSRSISPRSLTRGGRLPAESR